MLKTYSAKKCKKVENKATFYLNSQYKHSVIQDKPKTIFTMQTITNKLTLFISSISQEKLIAISSLNHIKGGGTGGGDDIEIGYMVNGTTYYGPYKSIDDFANWLKSTGVEFNPSDIQIVKL